MLGLQKGLESVENELADCNDMEGWTEQCQLVLKAVAGIDFQEFVKFLAYIARKRQLCLDGKETKSSANWNLGKTHARFDLVQISKVFKELYHCMAIQNMQEIGDIHEILNKCEMF